MPDENEIMFARTRAAIQKEIATLVTNLAVENGFQCKSVAGNLAHPTGKLDPNTIQGQELKFNCCFSNSSQDIFRFDIVISHDEKWNAVTTLYPPDGKEPFSVNIARPDLADVAVEAVRLRLQDELRILSE